MKLPWQTETTIASKWFPVKELRILYQEGTKNMSQAIVMNSVFMSSLLDVTQVHEYTGLVLNSMEPSGFNQALIVNEENFSTVF